MSRKARTTKSRKTKAWTTPPSSEEKKKAMPDVTDIIGDGITKEEET